MQETWDSGSIPRLGRSRGVCREWQPAPVFLPGESQDQKSLVGYSLGGHKELDMTEGLRWRQCQVENKSPWTPSNPFKGLHLFYSFRGWISCILLNSFGDNTCLSWQNDFWNLQQCLGLEFSVVSPPIFSTEGVLVKSAYLASEASLLIF